MPVILILVLSFLFASGIVADRHRGQRQSGFHDDDGQLTNAASDAVEYSKNWAGAILEKSNGTFTAITGKFVVPIPSGENRSASAWVGIDGDGCPGGLFQTGLDFDVNGKNEITYAAWYEWFPDGSHYWPDFSISAGDTIQTTIVTFDATCGKAVVENITRNQTKVAYVNSTYALCGQSAEWIVEDNADEHGTPLPFANFGTVTFTDASATGPTGIFKLEGATVLDIRQQNQILTSVSIDGSSSVTIKHT